MRRLLAAAIAGGAALGMIWSGGIGLAAPDLAASWSGADEGIYPLESRFIGEFVTEGFGDLIETDPSLPEALTHVAVGDADISHLEPGKLHLAEAFPNESDQNSPGFRMPMVQVVPSIPPIESFRTISPDDLAALDGAVIKTSTAAGGLSGNRSSISFAAAAERDDGSLRIVIVTLKTLQYEGRDPAVVGRLVSEGIFSPE